MDASAEYRSFIREVESIHHTLRAIDRVAKTCARRPVESHIVREVDVWWQAVEKTLEELAEFATLGRDQQQPSGSRIRVSGTVQKVRWRLLKRDEIRAYETEFTSRRIRLGTLLQLRFRCGVLFIGIIECPL